MSLRDYIVRIYRCEKDNPRKIVGVVEEVGKESKRAFTYLDELWEILNQEAGTEKQSGSKKQRVRGARNNHNG